MLHGRLMTNCWISYQMTAYISLHLSNKELNTACRTSNQQQWRCTIILYISRMQARSTSTDLHVQRSTGLFISVPSFTTWNFWSLIRTWLLTWWEFILSAFSMGNYYWNKFYSQVWLVLEMIMSNLNSFPQSSIQRLCTICTTAHYYFTKMAWLNFTIPFLKCVAQFTYEVAKFYPLPVLL